MTQSFRATTRKFSGSTSAELPLKRDHIKVLKSFTVTEFINKNGRSSPWSGSERAAAFRWPANLTSSTVSRNIYLRDRQETLPISYLAQPLKREIKLIDIPCRQRWHTRGIRPSLGLSTCLIPRSQSANHYCWGRSCFRLGTVSRIWRCIVSRDEWLTLRTTVESG